MACSTLSSHSKFAESIIILVSNPSFLLSFVHCIIHDYWLTWNKCSENIPRLSEQNYGRFGAVPQSRLCRFQLSTTALCWGRCEREGWILKNWLQGNEFSRILRHMQSTNVKILPCNGEIHCDTLKYIERSVKSNLVRGRYMEPWERKFTLHKIILVDFESCSSMIHLDKSFHHKTDLYEDRPR